jgi:predicted acyltransferase
LNPSAVSIPSPAESTTAPLPQRPSRLLSIDLLRGLTIGFMILVNNPADETHSYWPLKHADWNGFTPTDLVFPTFLFLVGVATVFSLSSRLAQGANRMNLFTHVVRRSAIIFFLGVFLNGFPLFHLHTLRIYGVLPRIGICYFIVATLYLIRPSWRSNAAIAAACLVSYWILVRFVPVPGYGVPTHDVPLLDRDGNLVAWLDRKLFSPSHLWERTRDPEGILSTIPAVATALLGVLAGTWLRTSRSLMNKAAGLAIAGVSGVLLGGLWNLTFPINKKMWTSSYVLFAGGLSLLLLALAVVLVDIPSAREPKAERAQRSGWFTPLLVFGTNAIAAYVIADLYADLLPFIHVRRGVDVMLAYYRLIQHFVPDVALSSLLFALSFVVLCWVPVYVLYRRKIFLKI